MRRGFLIIVLGTLLFGVSAGRCDSTDSILEKIGVGRGICVVLGEGACGAALELAKKSQLLIYVQTADVGKLEAGRRRIDDAGLYGTRIFVEKGALSELHLAGNIADAVVVLGEGDDVPKDEVLRVLRPEGKALLGGNILTKRSPEGADDWRHPYHGPDNNPQSEDSIIEAPYLTQFLADPRYAPVPQVAVASGGRIFKAFGHVAFKEREEPFLNKLAAFNGYNGTMLWQREITAGLMIHRNTMIATPKALYLGDDKSCKVIDAVSGRLVDEISPGLDVAGGTFWKWMGMEDGVLYALIGEQEQKDPTMRWQRERHGWPWNPISKGFNQPDKIKDSAKAYEAHPWGFGRNVLAIDPESKEVLWSHAEEKPIDSRAMCMRSGRIFIFRFGGYLACLDAKGGSVIWRKTPENAPELFEAIGAHLNRQGASFNWRTTAYLKCSDKALYFAGPTVGNLVAVSAEDGKVLWTYPYGNFQLIVGEDGLYAISGQNDRGKPSFKFDLLTGAVLGEFETGRRACTRPTGAADSIFYRARGGSTRFDLQSESPRLVSPMRPPCQDGVTIANGLLYWWPYVCDCQLTLYGITSLGPAGDFDFAQLASDAGRLEKGAGYSKDIASLHASPFDWPTFRADNRGSATTKAAVAEKAELLWEYEPTTRISSAGPRPTPPVAVGGMVFSSGPDGIVRALDAATGKLKWKAYTAGAVRIAPTIRDGRACVGSGDGWVYSFEAATGKLLWRFRAAPAERKIPVYGALLSTWPAASGVIVDNGIAYVAAGLANYDGTYVYALDAATGRIKWQNTTSGHLDADARSGVGVQGHLLLSGGKLYLAGGNAVSPGVYDAKNGKCLNDPDTVQRITQNNVLLTQSPRGWELSLIGESVVACGRPFYAHPEYEVYDSTVFGRVFISSGSGRDVVWASNQAAKRVMCFDPIDKKLLSERAVNPRNPLLVDWGQMGVKKKPLWSHSCLGSLGIAVCRNAVVIAEKSRVLALDIKDGSLLWSCPLPSSPVEWGLAVDRNGRVLVVLDDGKILCFGRPGKI